jgi:hypothetical protein
MAGNGDFSTESEVLKILRLNCERNRSFPNLPEKSNGDVMFFVCSYLFGLKIY